MSKIRVFSEFTLFFMSVAGCRRFFWCLLYIHLFIYYYIYLRHLATINNVYTHAWEIFTPEVYAIKTDDITMQIKELIQIINFSCDCCFESYWGGHGDGSKACIIELKDKRIYANFWVNDVNEDEYNVYLECTETERALLFSHIASKFEEVAHEIQKFALEPQISEILASNYEEEYERIKEIIVPAIYVCPYATSSACKDSEKRMIMLNNKQIMIILKCEDKVNASPNERPYISASIECITTGRSKSCTINPFDKTPTELIRKIQALAWEKL